MDIYYVKASMTSSAGEQPLDAGEFMSTAASLCQEEHAAMLESSELAEAFARWCKVRYTAKKQPMEFEVLVEMTSPDGLEGFEELHRDVARDSALVGQILSAKIEL